MKEFLSVFILSLLMAQTISSQPKILLSFLPVNSNLRTKLDIGSYLASKDYNVSLLML